MPKAIRLKNQDLNSGLSGAKTGLVPMGFAVSRRYLAMERKLRPHQSAGAESGSVTWGNDLSAVLPFSFVERGEGGCVICCQGLRTTCRHLLKVTGLTTIRDYRSTADEKVTTPEKREPSCIGGIAKWHSHYGKQ